jgi:hypothetical protein
MAAMKDLWRGTIKLGNAALVEYVYANSEKQARMLILKRIAKRDGVPTNAAKDAAKVYVEKEIEFTEAECADEGGTTWVKLRGGLKWHRR